MILVIDCQTAGISGDMMVAALIDLGANAKKVVSSMEFAGRCLSGGRDISVQVKQVKRHGFAASYVEVLSNQEKSVFSGDEFTKAVSRCVVEAGLGAKAKKFALGVFETLLGAEARVHGSSVKDVHLHEAGSVDTVADVVGVACACNDLKLFDEYVYTTPVAVGGGSFEFSHGLVSCPGPAVLEMLKSKEFTLVGGPVHTELTTPTGAAILVNLARTCVPVYPPIVPRIVGYGAGRRELVEVANVLRLVLGDSPELVGSESICVLETNVDDVSGEVLGHMLQRLVTEGALDVTIIPAVTKKNRPSHVVRVFTNPSDQPYFTRLLMEETGTLGVRILPAMRQVSVRGFHDVTLAIKGRRFKVRLKLVTDSRGRILNAKPEYDDVKSVADTLSIPYRSVWQMAMKKVPITL